MVLAQHFEDLIESLNKTDKFNLPSSKENAFKIEYSNVHDVKCESASYNGKKPQLPFAASEIFFALLHKWRRLTAIDDKCKPVYEITFDIKGSDFCFKPGDIVGIIPLNTKTEVNFLIDRLDLKDTVDFNYTLILNGFKGAKIPSHVPVQSTLRYVLSNCVDLRSIVKKLFLLALSKYTKDENEKKILEYLCSKEGSNVYTSHILNKNICILDLLSILISCKPPIEVLLEHLPRLLPRPYSIVNRQTKDDILKICFSVKEIGHNRKGLTTAWLESLILEKNIDEMMNNLSIDKGFNKIPMYLRKNINEFYMPDNCKSPLILIGPGTGVSPFIGFLEEREFLKKNNSGLEFGQVWLFYGCRDPNLDFIYEKELRYFESEKIITHLKLAYSRFDDTNVHYVQDAIVENGKEITNLIMQGVYIYVCGDVKVMATQVKEIIVQCVEQYGEMTKEQAELILSNMQKEKRYLNDIWN